MRLFCALSIVSGELSGVDELSIWAPQLQSSVRGNPADMALCLAFDRMHRPSPATAEHMCKAG